jgi:uncharacterized protein (DUF1501 family)
MITRRAFLKAGAITMFGIGAGGIPPFMARAAESSKASLLYKKKKVLVCIFQRGAMDGLTAVTPFNDTYLQAARPDLFITPSQQKGGSIDLDGRFALHPSMTMFEPLFREKRLAIVHGMGSPNKTRSHFDAQDYMESGTPFDKYTTSGWLNRASGLMGNDATPFRAVSLTSSMPRALIGDHPALAIRNLQDFAVQTNGNQSNATTAAKSFEDLYDQTSSSLLKETGKETFDAIKMLQSANLSQYKPAMGASYPGSSLGNALKQIAQLIKMDAGLEIAFAESGGWDTHSNQGATAGAFAKNANDLSRSISAFWTDVEAYQDMVTLMTMTEFGRTVKQNGTRGTDHGRASCNFILGNDVQGGVVYGDVKELAIENLEDRRDLPVTTDFRTVFNAVATNHLQIQNNKLIFPDWEETPIDLMRKA